MANTYAYLDVVHAVDSGKPPFELQCLCGHVTVRFIGDRYRCSRKECQKDFRTDFVLAAVVRRLAQGEQ